MNGNRKDGEGRSIQLMHSFSAEVITGRQIGRQIGFPTANLAIEGASVDLENGVYGVKLFHEKDEYNGIMNVGVRPTFKEEILAKHYEVHIFDFDQQIYGDQVTIDVYFFIREEKKFSSVEQLIEQIQKDKQIASTIWLEEVKG